jgi:hypothetical protein
MSGCRHVNVVRVPQQERGTAMVIPPRRMTEAEGGFILWSIEPLGTGKDVEFEGLSYGQFNSSREI